MSRHACLHLLCGKAGAGKSTLAAELAFAHRAIVVSEDVCLQRIEQRNVERPEGSHPITPEVFAYVTSFFEAPEAAEGFRIERHAAAGSVDAAARG